MSSPVVRFRVAGRTGAIVWHAEWRTFAQLAGDAAPREDAAGWILRYEIGGSARQVALTAAPPWDGVKDEDLWSGILTPHAVAALPPDC